MVRWKRPGVPPGPTPGANGPRGESGPGRGGDGGAGRRARSERGSRVRRCRNFRFRARGRHYAIRLDPVGAQSVCDTHVAPAALTPHPSESDSEIDSIPRRTRWSRLRSTPRSSKRSADHSADSRRGDLRLQTTADGSRAISLPATKRAIAASQPRRVRPPSRARRSRTCRAVGAPTSCPLVACRLPSGARHARSPDTASGSAPCACRC